MLATIFLQEDNIVIFIYNLRYHCVHSMNFENKYPAFC